MSEELIDYIMKKDPKTTQAKLRKVWPEIEQLLDQKISVLEIWKGVKEVHKIECSYSWFARFVRAQKMGLDVVSHAAKKSTEQKNKSSLAKGKSNPTTEALRKMSDTPPKKPSAEQDELDEYF